MSIQCFPLTLVQELRDRRKIRYLLSITSTAETRETTYFRPKLPKTLVRGPTPTLSARTPKRRASAGKAPPETPSQRTAKTQRDSRGKAKPPTTTPPTVHDTTADSATLVGDQSAREISPS